MEKAYPIPQQDYMVLIICCTYNQKDFIEETLKGFIIQKTNFPFIALIIDDASTDETTSIIKQYESQYPNIIKGIYLEENHYRKKPKEPYIKPWREKCKYEAICEGDDYWIDPYKLQKQVDILQSNDKYGLCYTKSHIYYQKENKFSNIQIGSEFNNFEELLLGNKIPTLTALYRIDLYKKYINEINPINKKWLMGDYPQWLWFGYNSKIIFLNEITSVYRVLEESACHFNDIIKKEKFEESVRDIRLFYLNKYFNNSRLEDTINDIYYRENYRNGENESLRIYCLDNLKKIKNKSVKERLKLLLYKIPWGFSLRMKIKTHK